MARSGAPDRQTLSPGKKRPLQETPSSESGSGWSYRDASPGCSPCQPGLTHRMGKNMHLRGRQTGFPSQFCHLLAVQSRASFQLTKPQFPRQQNAEGDSSDFTGLLWESDWMVHTAQILTRSKI